MYEVVFKCVACGVHLSASADDAGFEFECPNCSAAISVPAGDILFSCGACDVNILAAKDAVGEVFECPRCQRRVQVPKAGRTIEVKERPEPADSVRQPEPASEIVPERVPANEPPSASDRQFMSAWGDFIAQAGLANDKEDEKRPDSSATP